MQPERERERERENLITGIKVSRKAALKLSLAVHRYFLYYSAQNKPETTHGTLKGLFKQQTEPKCLIQERHYLPQRPKSACTLRDPMMAFVVH